MGLCVHAGHGLTYRNVIPVAAIPEIEELNIGHSVVSRAVMVGMRDGGGGDARTWCAAQGADTFRAMTNPLAAADFFALEAGECLDRLETLVGRPDAPPADEFLRTARVLRGSALMAGQQPIARAAAGLEGLARAYRDGRRPWDPATREQAAQAIEEFRLLVRRVREWGEPETARSVRLGLSLESLAGRRPAPPRAGEPARRDERGELNTGVRAFVAREGALIASALDRAARALRAAPGDREPLYNVIRRMQSLRGLAELGELVPLPEILDGIELAVGDLTRLFAPPPGVDEVIAAAVHGAHPHLARHRGARPARARDRGGPALHRAAAARLRRRARRGPDRVALFRRRPRADDPAAHRSRSLPRPRRSARSSWSATASTCARAPTSSRARARPSSATSGSIICWARCARPPRPAPTPSPARWSSSPARPGRRWPRASAARATPAW